MKIDAQKSGIALIMAVGILAVIALVAVGFSAFTRLELRATENYADQLKAEFIAEAGIANAIKELKYGTAGAKYDPYDTVADTWYYQGNSGEENPVDVELKDAALPSFGAAEDFGGGQYKLKVVDCAGLINVNAPLPDTNAEDEMKNTLEALALAAGLNPASAQDFSANLVPFRKTLPNEQFASKSEIKLIPDVGPAIYDKIKNYITLYGDEDDGIFVLNKSGQTPSAEHTRKVFVNVNTASKAVLIAVIKPMINSASDPLPLVNAIISRRASNPFDGKNSDADVKNFLSARGEFQRFLEYQFAQGTVSAGDLDALLLYTDPNRYDFTDAATIAATRSRSTYFCFDSGGCYEIESLGEYHGARKRIKQAVCIYRKIYETSKNEFNSANASTRRVTWKDSCPVDYSVLKSVVCTVPDSALVPNSVKPGFWDDFSEDYGTAGTDTGDWLTLEQKFEINKGGDSLLRTWPNGVFVDGVDYFPKVELDSSKWKFNRFSLRARLIEETDNSKSTIRTDLPWVAVPIESDWQACAPVPSALNCPDIASGKYTVAEVQAMSTTDNSHERFLNVGHIQFGIPPDNMSAIYCSFPQTQDLLTHLIDIYGQWVNYDGNGYIYFAPVPDVKAKDVLNKPNLMIVCNDYFWTGHSGVDGTKDFIMPGYFSDKTIRFKSRDQRSLNASVYYPLGTGTGSLDVNTGIEPVEVWQNRLIRFVGMGNFFDLDDVRIIPERGVYTSSTFDPTEIVDWNTLEWGTISAGVSVSPNAVAGYIPGDTERVYISTNFTSGESVHTAPAPGAIHPAGALQACGGFIDSGTYPGIIYRVYFYAGYDDPSTPSVIEGLATNYEEIAVLEDMTITYMPRTTILAQSKGD